MHSARGRTAKNIAFGLLIGDFFSGVALVTFAAVGAGLAEALVCPRLPLAELPYAVTTVERAGRS